MTATRDVSRRQEAYVAALLGGRCVVNSGATSMRKGDGRVDTDLLLECKTVMKRQQQVTLDRRWLEGIREQAFAMRCELSAVAVDFGERPEYFVVREDVFVELFQAWQQLRRGEG